MSSKFNSNATISFPDKSFWWQKRLNDVKSFFKSLREHPSAMIGGIIVLIFILMAIFSPFIIPHSSTSGNLENRLAPPMWMEGGSGEHILGTDEQGIDILSRIIHGSRVSIVVGLLATVTSVVVGTTLGLIAGYYRGWFDNVVSRIADIILAFPFLIFAIFMMAFLGPGFMNLIFALTFIGWVEFFRLARGESLVEHNKEYVEAAKSLGRRSIKIMVDEILPNIVQTIFVLATLRFGYMIIMEASLSFLGLGIQPPTPAWGSMIASGRDYMFNAWWLSTFPGLTLLILVLSINLFGEGLRDILDPKMKGK